LTDREKLESAGWRIVAEKRGKYHNVNLWTHDNHQPSRAGFFTTTAAQTHQRFLDKGNTCHCVPKEPTL